MKKWILFLFAFVALSLMQSVPVSASPTTFDHGPTIKKQVLVSLVSAEKSSLEISGTFTSSTFEGILGINQPLINYDFAISCGNSLPAVADNLIEADISPAITRRCICNSERQRQYNISVTPQNKRLSIHPWPWKDFYRRLSPGASLN
jgi:hypothetical protein